jgi:enamine deaminase RidA (YjgF/YER057c/UK114 family)
MAKRTNFGSGTPWEESVGYSRAVRVGDVIHVAGTTALDEQGRLGSSARERRWPTSYARGST